MGEREPGERDTEMGQEKGMESCEENIKDKDTETVGQDQAQALGAGPSYKQPHTHIHSHTHTLLHTRTDVPLTTH